MGPEENKVVVRRFMHEVLAGGNLDVVDGDAVCARFNFVVTAPDGSSTTSRVLAYYRLTDGRIDVRHVVTVANKWGNRPAGNTTR